jgi:hypothetical protein
LNTVTQKKGAIVLLLFLSLTLIVTGAFAHPGSGIVVDSQGQVYFVDTGKGVWKIDNRGRLTPHPGSAFHWMTMDFEGRFAKTRWPAFNEPSSVLERVGMNPTLIVSSDFPLTIGRDGAIYFPDLNRENRLQIIRLTPSNDRTVLASLPPRLRWLNGVAAGPEGSIYYTENDAVRRVSPQGVISTVAEKITVPDCAPIPDSVPELGPFLRGLDVAKDGTVYVAASACGAVLKVTARGVVTPVLRSISPWSPTGVAVHGNEVYVLEYLHVAGDDRRAWIPRVRKLSPGGQVRVLATVKR